MHCRHFDITMSVSSLWGCATHLCDLSMHCVRACACVCVSLTSLISMCVFSCSFISACVATTVLGNSTVCVHACAYVCISLTSLISLCVSPAPLSVPVSPPLCWGIPQSAVSYTSCSVSLQSYLCWPKTSPLPEKITSYFHST